MYTTHLKVHEKGPPGSMCTKYTWKYMYKPTWKYMYKTRLDVSVQNPPRSTCTKATWKCMYKNHLEVHVQNPSQEQITSRNTCTKSYGSNVQIPPGSKCTKTLLEVNVQNPPGSTCTKPTWKYMYLFSKLQQDHQVSTITCLWRETQNVRL